MYLVHNASTMDANAHDNGTRLFCNWDSESSAYFPSPNKAGSLSRNKLHTLSTAMEVLSENVPCLIICICLLFNKSDSIKNSTASETSFSWLIAHSRRTCSPSSNNSNNNNSLSGPLLCCCSCSRIPLWCDCLFYHILFLKLHNDFSQLRSITTKDRQNTSHSILGTSVSP